MQFMVRFTQHRRKKVKNVKLCGRVIEMKAICNMHQHIKIMHQAFCAPRMCLSSHPVSGAAFRASRLSRPLCGFKPLKVVVKRRRDRSQKTVWITRDFMLFVITKMSNAIQQHPEPNNMQTATAAHIPRTRNYTPIGCKLVDGGGLAVCRQQVPTVHAADA